MNMEHLDLSLMKHEVELVFGTLYGDVPEMDCSDIFDGDTLALFAGRHFSEIPGILRDVDLVPFFALVDESVGKYYLGGYLLYFIEQIKDYREFYYVNNSTLLRDVEYVTLMNFLDNESVASWVKTVEPLSYIIRKFLSILSNTAALALGEEELLQINRIRISIS